MTRFTSLAVTVVLALSSCGITGAVVASGQHDEGSGQSTPATTTPRKESGQPKVSHLTEETTALLKARVNLAQKGYEAADESLQQTQRYGDVVVLIGEPEDVYMWSIRWLEAEREMSPRGPITSLPWKPI